MIFEEDAEFNDETQCIICLASGDSDTLLTHVKKISKDKRSNDKPHMTGCNKKTHRECLLNWMNSAIKNGNRNAFKCANCRDTLSPEMILAATHDNFDEMRDLLSRYKIKFGLTNDEFIDMLVKIGFKSEDIYKIMEMISNNPVTIAITQLKNPDHELYKLTHQYAKLIVTGKGDEQHLVDAFNHFFRNLNEHPISIRNAIAIYIRRRLMHIIRTEYNSQVQLVINVDVYQSIACTIEESDYRATGEILQFHEHVNLETELQGYYNNLLMQDGRFTHIARPYGIAQNPFPNRITVEQWLNERLIRCKFPFRIGCAKSVLFIHDSIVDPIIHKGALKNECNIMGGKSRRHNRRRRRRRTNKKYKSKR